MIDGRGLRSVEERRSVESNVQIPIKAGLVNDVHMVLVIESILYRVVYECKRLTERAAVNVASLYRTWEQCFCRLNQFYRLQKRRQPSAIRSEESW